MLREYLEDNKIKELLITVNKGFIFCVVVKREDLSKFMKLDIAKYVVDVTEYSL